MFQQLMECRIRQTLTSIKQVSLVCEEREILRTTDEFHQLGLSLSHDLRNKEKGEEDLHTLFTTFNGKLSAITTLIENHIIDKKNNNSN